MKGLPSLVQPPAFGAVEAAGAHRSGFRRSRAGLPANDPAQDRCRAGASSGRGPPTFLGAGPAADPAPLDGAGAAQAIDRRGGSTMQDDIEHERHKKRERNADQDALPPRNQHVPWHGRGLSAF